MLFQVLNPSLRIQVLNPFLSLQGGRMTMGPVMTGIGKDCMSSQMDTIPVLIALSLCPGHLPLPRKVSGNVVAHGITTFFFRQIGLFAHFVNALEVFHL
jgi:hypothetical protein